MKIISWNINGLRSVVRKGSLDSLNNFGAKIICLQETKIQENQIPWDIKQINSYSSIFNSADKKGYSGVAIYSKIKPKIIKRHLGIKRFDSEGRILRIDFSKFSLINLYMPHGARDKKNLDFKLEAYDFLLSYLEKEKKNNFILIGDFNIAHQEIDLARPRNNYHNIMFTPEERGQIDRLLALGFVDTFRLFNRKGENFTWWPYRFKARERNLGWRIDYGFVSKKLVPEIKNAYILSKVLGSDHCPIGLDIF